MERQIDNKIKRYTYKQTDKKIDKELDIDDRFRYIDRQIDIDSQIYT